MGHYKPNVRDLEFNLFEVLELEKTLAGGEFGDLDGDTVRDMLGEAARLAQGPLAEPFTEGDRNPPTFDPRTHGVTLPDGFKAAVRAWMDAGWSRVGLEEAIGGVRTPSTVACAIISPTGTWILRRGGRPVIRARSSSRSLNSKTCGPPSS